MKTYVQHYYITSSSLIPVYWAGQVFFSISSQWPFSINSSVTSSLDSS